MKATAQTHDVATGFRAVTLLVEDFTPFPLGVQVEIEVKQIEQPQPPAAMTTATPPPENVVTLPPINAGGSKEETVTTITGTTPPPDACEVCKGSGAVSQFPDATTPGSGNPVPCETCKGTGVKQTPPPLNT